MRSGRSTPIVFHIIGDGKIKLIVGVCLHTHYKDSLLKVGCVYPKYNELMDPGTHGSVMGFLLKPCANLPRCSDVATDLHPRTLGKEETRNPEFFRRLMGVSTFQHGFFQSTKSFETFFGFEIPDSMRQKISY